ncbi:universal stress protein [Aquimarina hainanensis]|uniref:Universal stress protein n=1 Tax=Aquimarina hainanensis TaxID=1578017 RepID=A0ABW5N1Z0_9FLAO
MRKILIPTDFSENAMNAFRYGAELYKYERCEFFILHAYADEVYAEEMIPDRKTFEALKNAIHKKTIQQLTEVETTLRGISPNPKHEYHKIAVFDELVDAANVLADQENIDLILMGTKGQTSHKYAIFGSNTLHLMKYVKCPVLAIPQSYGSYTQPKKILFPTNFKIPYKKRELRLLSTISKSYRSMIHMLFISDSDELSFRQEDNKLFLEDCFKENHLTFHREASESLSQEINTFIRDKAIDMLVMVNSRHSFLEYIFFQSTIDKIGLQITIPFLVMQNLPRK